MVSVLAVALALPWVGSVPAAAASSTLVVNEIDYDQASTDTAEFVELKNVSSGPIDLDAYSVELVNGNGTLVYQTIDLPGVSLASGDYFVICGSTATVAECDLDAAPDSNLVQNGSPDAVAIKLAGAIVDTVSYEGDTGAPYTEGSGAGLDDDPDQADLGISRFPDGTDTDQNNADLSARCITPGAANSSASTGCEPVEAGSLVVNEIDYDQPSTDGAEFLEIKNAGNAAVDLDPYIVDLVNGNGTTVYQSINLPSTMLGAGDYFVVCGNAANVAECDLDASPDTNLIQNGSPDAVAITLAGAIIDTVSYEGDTGAPYTEGSGVGLEDTDELDHGISRFPDGTDTNQNNADLSLRCITPGATNSSASGSCEPPVTARIRDIQDAMHFSPLDDRAVADVPGIVTAVSGNGFWFQDPDPDASNATSEGIFVFTGSSPTVAVGDSILVDGVADEFFPGGFGSGNLSTSEITSPTIELVSSGNSLPAATVIGNGGRVPPSEVIDDDATGDVNTTGSFDAASDGIDFYESLEGMLVRVNDAVATSPTNNFGEIAVIGDNGANATQRTARGGVYISPTDFNPERVILDDALSSPATVDVGDTFTSPIIGPLDYSFGNFKLLHTSTPTVSRNGLTPETTDASVAGELSTASFNVENLDPGDGPEKFNGLAHQIVDNLASPDILGLEEVQDNNGATNDGTVDASVTYNALIAAITAAGGPTYDFRDVAPENNQDGGEPGGNIRVGFLFRPDRVSFIDRPGGDATTATTASSGPDGPELSVSPGRIDPTNAAWDDSRKPLAGEFEFNGEKLIVVANHFNSKGGDDPLFGRVQPPVLSSEVQRLQQAQVVNDFADSILAADPDANAIVLGDMNDFEFSPVLATLAGDVLTNLIESIPQIDRYTYVFDGNSQVLDNFLVTDALNAVPHEFDIVHANSEFSEERRRTDHEPLVGRFCLDQTGPELDVSVSPDVLWPPNHKYRMVEATVQVTDDADPDASFELVSVTSDEPDNGPDDGNTVNDIVIVDDQTFKLRAERSGSGDGRVYTVTYQATDTCGNVTVESATVEV
ncbi:MAG: lamin tail domain-containing protein, partial [Actinomycetota bacterium]